MNKNIPMCIYGITLVIEEIQVDISRIIDDCWFTIPKPENQYNEN